MKKIIFLFILSIIPLIAFSDVAPSDMHLVDNKILFTNLNEFPEIVLLGFILGPTYDSPHFFIIENNTSLQKGYKFNDFGMYWASSKYVEHVGVENIVINLNPGKEQYWGDYFLEVTNDPNIHFVTSAIDPGDFWVDDYDDLQVQICEYEIAGFVGDEILIYLAKQTKQYQDDEEIIETYDLPEIINLECDPFVDATSDSSSQ